MRKWTLTASLAVSTLAASAQSLCDLLSASTVQATLGIHHALRAEPDNKDGIGCSYRKIGPGPVTVTANTADDTPLNMMMFKQLNKPGPRKQTVSGIGEEGFYEQRDGQMIPKYPGLRFTQQSLVFHAKGKIISFIVLLPDPGVQKTAVYALGPLTLSKPLDTLTNQR